MVLFSERGLYSTGRLTCCWTQQNKGQGVVLGHCPSDIFQMLQNNLDWAVRANLGVNLDWAVRANLGVNVD